MRYLVTGGAGFIGSHLVDLLLSLKHEVIVVDDLSFGKLDNLSHVIKKIIFINKKIQNIDDESIEFIDGVFHLAAQASVPLSIKQFFESSKNNIESSLKVIDICRKQNIPIVYATSSAVYGNLPIGNDEVKDIDLESPYALDKLVLEQYAKLAKRVYGLSSIGLRFFNVYGPRQDASNPYSGVISIFADKMLKKQSIIINGGDQTRDFINVIDIVNTLYKSMQVCRNTLCCEVLNVGTGISVSINQLAEIISNLTKFTPKIEYRNLPLGDPERSEGTYNKLRDFLNIDTNSFINLEEGLIKTIEFFKEENERK